ncbi:MAG: hypothetical protein ACW96X_08685 [Promethearchaeota archaeon]
MCKEAFMPIFNKTFRTKEFMTSLTFFSDINITMIDTRFPSFSSDFSIFLAHDLICQSTLEKEFWIG